MTENATPHDGPAMAHGYGLMVPAPDGVDGAMAEVIGKHQAEFNAALEPFGVSIDVLVRATWMRFVRVGEVVAAYNGGVVPPEAPASEREEPPNCCGAGEFACSPTCSAPYWTEVERAAAQEVASAPAVDGVYVTDLPRESEGFGRLPLADAAPRCAGDGCGACAIDALPGLPRTDAAPEADRG